MAEPCIAVNPVIRSIAVQCPVCFVGVDGVIAAAELLGDFFLKMLSRGGFLNTKLNDVVCRQVTQHGAASGDKQPLFFSSAHGASVRADEAG